MAAATCPARSFLPGLAPRRLRQPRTAAAEDGGSNAAQARHGREGADDGGVAYRAADRSSRAAGRRPPALARTRGRSVRSSADRLRPAAGVTLESGDAGEESQKGGVPRRRPGTRVLPATQDDAEEMLTVVDKPLINIGRRGAGSRHRAEIFVTAAAQTALEDHFDMRFELEAVLRARGKCSTCSTASGGPAP